MEESAKAVRMQSRGFTCSGASLNLPHLASRAWPPSCPAAATHNISNHKQTPAPLASGSSMWDCEPEP